MPTWVELGPHSIPHGQTYGTGGNDRPPVSGRISGVAIDPDNSRHIFIASAGGGIWESTDRGVNWTPRTDFQPTLSMGAIVYAPSNSQVIYAGTGEGDTYSRLGVGILRSLDGGATWRLLQSPHLSGRGIYDLAVDPDDHRHLFAATITDLLESRDGAVTWTRRRARQTWDLSINPNNSSEIFACCDDGLYRSGNGGARWQKVTLPQMPGGTIDRMEVCHAPSNPGVAYVFASVGGRPRLWRRTSVNGGFRRQSVPPGLSTKQAWYDWCAAVDPGDENCLYLGAISLYRGKRRPNGTWNWTDIAARSQGDSIHPDQHFVTFEPGRPAVVYVGNDGGLFRSPDSGNKWTALNKGLGITEFEYIAQHPTNLSWIIGGTQDNGTLRHRGNLVWNQVAMGDGGDCGVNQNRPRTCYHSYYGLGFERSRTGGGSGSWTWIPLPNVDALFYPPLEVSGKMVVQAGDRAFISKDEGNSFDDVVLPQPSTQRVQLSSALKILNADSILVGTTHGRLYRIDRVQGAWQAPNLIGRPRLNAYMSDIFVDASDERRIWVTYSTINGGHVYLTTDGGSTWQNKSGNLPNIPVNAIVADPNDAQTIYVGGDNGVYRTTNAGTSWIDYSQGLPNAIVGDLLFHETQRVLRAATKARGVWELTL